MTHEHAWALLPDVVLERESNAALRAHVRGCHACQRQLFLLQRVDALLAEQPRERPRRPGFRPRRLARAVAPIAVALALFVAVFLSHGSQARSYALRSVGDRSVVARAEIRHGDAENDVIAFSANGLAGGRMGTYLLWASAGSDRGRVLVGRFMTDARGACRTRFNLPADRAWARFWITRATPPSTVVATT